MTFSPCRASHHHEPPSDIFAGVDRHYQGRLSESRLLGLLVSEYSRLPLKYLKTVLRPLSNPPAHLAANDW